MKQFKILIGLILLIGLINLVSAGNLSSQIYICNQESANKTYACGGIGTGSYSVYGDLGSIVNPNFIDEDYTSYAQIENVIGDSIYYVNYTKPFNFINASWTIKYSHAPIMDEYVLNFLINNTNCLNNSNLAFRLNKEYLLGATYNSVRTLIQCYNNTQWLNLSIVNDTGYYFYLHEEGINWTYYNLNEISQSFNSNTYEFSTENYYLNLTYNPSYSVITAKLFYNNTNYTATNTGTGTNAYFNTSIQIPSPNSTSEQKTFYWIIGLTNTTGTYYYNSNSNNQTINVITLQICNATFNKTALNISLFDSKYLTKLYNWTSKGVINYSIGTSSISKNYSYSSLIASELNLCISNNLNYTISGNIQNSLNGYNPTDYNFINQIINNQTTNLSLYILPQNLTTSFIMVVQGQNQLPLYNYYIYVYRYDPSNSIPYLQQVSKTDTLGQTIGFFEAYTVDYSFLIKDTTGNTVYTSEKKKMIPTTTPYTITFTVGNLIPSPQTYYDNTTGLSWTNAYNSATYVSSLTYTDSNSTFQSVYYIIKSMNMSGKNNVICNKTLSNPSGVLTCDLTGNQSGTYYAEFYVKRNNILYFINRNSFDIEGMSAVVGMLGVFGAFFILLLCSFAFAYNTVAGVIMLDIGVIFVNVMGLVNFGIVGISAVIGVSVLIIIVLGRD